MTARFPMTRVPEVRVDRGAGVVGLDDAVRVVNQNFRQIKDLLERAIAGGSLIADGSIVTAMLSTSARTLAGDVTGLTGTSAEGGATTVEKIQGKAIAAPTSSEDAKAIVYNHAGTAWAYADVLRDVLTTRGDLLYRGASAEGRLAVGAASTLLKSDGTDPAWTTLTSLLDTLFSSSQGAVLYRGASAWEALAPGTSGHYLKTQGAGANPTWASVSAGSSPLTTKGDLYVYSTVDDRLAVGTDGYVLTADSTAAKGVKWAAAASAGTNALLDGSTHTDTLAGTVVRGDLIVGNSTPKWSRYAIGGANKFLRSDGTDPTWQFDRAERANSAFVANGNFGNNTIFNAGIFSFTNAGGTQAASGDTARVANKYTQSVANAKTGPQAPSSAPLLTAAMSPVFWADFQLTTFTLCYLQVGFNGNGLQGSATKATTTHQAWLTFLAGTDTNFYFRLCDATTANAIDTGVAKDTAWHDVLIYTPDAGVTWKCELDGVQVASSSTNVPSTSQTLYACVGFTCGTGGTQNGELRTSYCKVQQANRM